MTIEEVTKLIYRKSKQLQRNRSNWSVLKRQKVRNEIALLRKLQKTKLKTKSANDEKTNKKRSAI